MTCMFLFRLSRFDLEFSSRTLTAGVGQRHGTVTVTVVFKFPAAAGDLLVPVLLKVGN